ncbi:hypothetical protein KJ359_003370 [Pestalotiopsis sp. 9143b]|nr:hypothetical protein KJ359_003370 [Pestalotiopsis sp. 9143b]
MTSPKDLVQETRGPGSRSLFLDKLPLEVRNAVYSYIWTDEGRDHHIYHRKNRLFHAKCVMDPLDKKDPDLIQKEMDRVHDMRVADKSKQAALQMWNKRLSSGSWGHRHWRCQERLDVSLRYGASDFLERDETSWMSMLLVCKQMYALYMTERHVKITRAKRLTRLRARYPEVLQSILEYHTFMLSDITSAHWFLDFKPPPLLQHVRHLEISLSPASYEFGPFFAGYRVDGETRLTRIMDRMCKFTCLHELRISFDTWHRGFWVDIREQDLFSQLAELRVLRDFTVEFPAGFIKAPEGLPHGHCDRVSKLEVVRKPPLRYWVSPSVPPMVSRVQRLSPVTASSQNPPLGATGRTRPGLFFSDY